MEIVQIDYGKAHFLELLDRVEQGEKLAIAKQGKVVAKLIPWNHVMNLKQTQKWLRHLRIPDYQYSINSLGNGDCMCIAFDFVPNEGWTVFYSERGQRGSIQYFSNEEDACDALIKAVVNNHKDWLDNFEYHRTRHTPHFQNTHLRWLKREND